MQVVHVMINVADRKMLAPSAPDRTSEEKIKSDVSFWPSRTGHSGYSSLHFESRYEFWPIEWIVFKLQRRQDRKPATTWYRQNSPTLKHSLKHLWRTRFTVTSVASLNTQILVQHRRSVLYEEEINVLYLLYEEQMDIRWTEIERSRVQSVIRLWYNNCLAQKYPEYNGVRQMDTESVKKALVQFAKSEEEG